MAERHHTKIFERLAQHATAWAGTSWSFALAVLIVLVWLVSGPLFNYSDTWQLVINTGTTIVTFLMVFLIQRTQNKESQAVQLKLNEIVAAVKGASNRLICIENLDEHELATLHSRYVELAQLAEKAGSPLASHSIEEAAREVDHKRKEKLYAQQKTSKNGRHRD